MIDFLHPMKTYETDPQLASKAGISGLFKACVLAPGRGKQVVQQLETGMLKTGRESHTA